MVEWERAGGFGGGTRAEAPMAGASPWPRGDSVGALVPREIDLESDLELDLESGEGEL